MQRREVIKLSDSQPTIVRLDFGAEGIQRDGKYGLDYQYTLNDNTAVMWVAPPVRDAIIASGAQAGDEISIQKHRGAYHVAVLGDAQEEPPPPAPAPSQTRAAHQHRQQQQEAPRAASNLSRRYQQTQAAAAAQATQPQQPATESHPIAYQMLGSYKVAIDALAGATAYARERGIEYSFNEDDVRATALSIFIDLRKGAR